MEGAREYLETALGGNLNVGTLTFEALVELVEGYANEQLTNLNITLSDTWLEFDLYTVGRILERTIEGLGKIINVESKTDERGLSRFWVYSLEKQEQ